MGFSIPSHLKLSPEDQDILRWAFVDQQSKRQIAGWLNRSVKWVEIELTTLRRALAMNGIELPVRKGGRPRGEPEKAYIGEA